ncbi:hypothetical protein [Pseudonocardia sp. GCM10023141]|uniref:hypothetical protein n=1 Tax=Pseudonocardia sp. GCM10023141 TaxID=3252653 RepID=UPI0036081E5B
MTHDPDFGRSVAAGGPGDSSFSARRVSTLPGGRHDRASVALTRGVLMLLARAPGSALLRAALAAMILVARRHRAGRRET